MKRKLFLILLAFIGVIKVSAQEVDMLQENYTDAKIEELSQKVVVLSQRLEQLQEDYLFLTFINQLEDVIFEIRVFDSEVSLKISEIEKMCHNSSFDIDQYLIMEDRYGKFQDLYDLLLHNKNDILKQISGLTFSYERQNYINTQDKELDDRLMHLDKGIKSYKRYLDVYKEKRKGY